MHRFSHATMPLLNIFRVGFGSCSVMAVNLTTSRSSVGTVNGSPKGQQKNEAAPPLPPFPEIETVDCLDSELGSDRQKVKKMADFNYTTHENLQLKPEDETLFMYHCLCKWIIYCLRKEFTHVLCCVIKVGVLL